MKRFVKLCNKPISLSLLILETQFSLNIMFILPNSWSVIAVLRWVNIYLKPSSAFIVDILSICWTVFTKVIGRSSMIWIVCRLLLSSLREQQFDCTHGFRRPSLSQGSQGEATPCMAEGSHAEQRFLHSSLGSGKWTRPCGQVVSWKACFWWPTSTSWLPLLNAINSPKIALPSGEKKHSK